MNWLDYQIERNLSWRAEEILNEIHGVTKESVDVPDSSLTLAEIAGAVMTGSLETIRERRWEAK